MFCFCSYFWWVPAGSPSHGEDVAVKPTELAHHSFFILFLCLFLSLCSFNCVSFYKFSRQLSNFSFCSSGLISAFLVLSTIYLCMNVSFSPDIILCGCLGLRHHLTDLLFLVANKSSALFPFLFPSPGPHISSSSFCWLITLLRLICCRDCHYRLGPLEGPPPPPQRLCVH